MFKHSLLAALLVVTSWWGIISAQTVQQQTHSSQITSCIDGVFDIVYYLWENGNQPIENFISPNSNVHWKFNVNSSQNPSYVSLFNPFNLITTPAFTWVSNGRPKNVPNDILVWAAASPLSVAPTLNGYTNRNTIAAQLAFWLHRNSWNDGFIPRTINYTTTNWAPQTQNIQHATTANSDGGWFECLNIHVAFCGDGIVDNTSTAYSSTITAPLAWGESCDDGNTNNNDVCRNDCTWNTPVCGGVNGQTYYDDQEPPLGDEINATTPWLCPAGQTVVNFQYNPAQATRTWNCSFANPGAPISSQCQAFENYCGDNIVQSGQGEQCDGTGQPQCGGGQSCNASCQCTNNPIPGVCGGASGQTYYDDQEPPLGDEINQGTPWLCAAGLVLNFQYNTANGTWTWSCQGQFWWPNSNVCIAYEDYCGDNILQATYGEQCDGAGQAQCTTGETCNQTTCGCDELPVGVCGSADGQTYYAFADNGTALNQNSPWLCPVGQTVVSFSWNQATHTFSRNCVDGWGQSLICEAEESYCGDGILGEGIGYTNQEQCDDGNTDPFDDCVTYDQWSPVCLAPYCGDGYVQIHLDEICDDGNQINGDGCDNNCTLTPNPGVCGWVDGQVIYDFDNNGDALNQNSPWLCVNGTVTDFVYNPTTHSWSWNCLSPNGGENDICNATELWCGNNIVEANQGEQCDGTGQAQCGAGQTCNQCGCISNPLDGVCGGSDGQVIYDFDNNGDGLNQNSPWLCANGTIANFVYNPTTHSWSWSCNGANGGENDVCTATELWCGNNIVEANQGEQCDGTGQAQCGVGQTCSQCGCLSNPLDGVCGWTDGEVIYDVDNNGDALNQTSPWLCADGNVSVFFYNSQTHTWSWQCVWLNGGQTDFCQASELWCGNNIVEANQGEQCDGNGQAQCSSGETCLACWCVYQPDCGNGIVDPGEACDDANSNNSDACTNTCALTWCGDGIIQNPNGQWGNERCDDGNTNNNDGCTNTCMETYCGDGTVQAPNAQGQNELCDDGNQNDSDGCSNSCAPNPLCGNGIVDTGEFCDDGNTLAGDGCTPSCQDEFCGDGYRDPNGGDNISSTQDDEACEQDVHCPIAGSWCVSGCTCIVPTTTFCGDGIVQTPNSSGQMEQCDDWNQDDSDACSNACTLAIPSVCELLSVNTTTQNAPMHITYSCLGSWAEVEVQLFTSAWVLLESAQTATWTFLVTTPDTYSVICTYDEITSAACQRTVEVGGYCEELSATLLTGQTYDFACEGSGSNYLLVITNDEEQVVTTASATGDFTFTYTFAQSGSYSAVCFVDGISNATCANDATNAFTTQARLVEDTSTDGWVVTVKNSSTTHLASVDNVDYRTHWFEAVDTLLPVLQKHALEKKMTTFMSNLQPEDITLIITPTPQVLRSEFGREITETVTMIEDQLTTSCSNSCLQDITITFPDTPTDPDPVCVLTTMPTNTIVNASSLTVTGSCAFSGVQWTSSLDCGNGTVLTGSVGSCTYTGNGSWTMSCQLDGASFPWCTQPVSLKSWWSSGGSSSGGWSSGWGTPSSIKCGNGKIDPGEMCDDGIKNGKRSICTSTCTLKWIRPVPPTTDDPPKCAFIDPPSIQLGEILPFWRGIEDDSEVTSQNLCTAAGEGKIPQSSLRCHFTVDAPDGTKYTFDESCTTDKLKSVWWYSDLQKDLWEQFSPQRGQSYIDTSKRSAQVYGEYTITLDKISYAICVETAAATTTSPARYAMDFDQAYEWRVCQFNFAVTTPYLIQKGTSLSSFSDDVQRLRKFLRIDGRSVLNVSSISLLEQTTRSDMFATMKKSVYAAANKAVQAVDVAHPLGSMNSGFKKVPNQELYVIDTGFILRHTGKITPFNNWKPTTIIVRGAVEVRLVGSLAWNLLIVAPEGTVMFVNEQCDATDTVEATIVAANIATSLAGWTANRSLTSKEWCTDGKLVVRWVVVSEQRSGIANVRAERRSTLNDWFDGTDSKAEHIYLWASLRIESKPSVWSLQPPLAKDNALFITNPWHGSADELILPLSEELLQALLPLFL
jgi:cysteine-rich repeat protein